MGWIEFDVQLDPEMPTLYKTYITERNPPLDSATVSSLKHSRRFAMSCNVFESPAESGGVLKSVWGFFSQKKAVQGTVWALSGPTSATQCGQGPNV